MSAKSGKILTTRERIELLSSHMFLIPYFSDSFADLLEQEFGHVDALDEWMSFHGGALLSRVRAPKLIYHICAGNLAISAERSLTLGLLLGAKNVLKLPNERDDSTTREELLFFIRQLPRPLKNYVEAHDELDEATLQKADVIIAFGSDATMEQLRARTRWNQKFIAHGHAVSLLWIEKPESLKEPDVETRESIARLALDIITYDQLGCLSPQAIYLPDKKGIESFGDLLAQDLEYARKLTKFSRPLAAAAKIQEARDVAHALGHCVWLPPDKHLGWTIIYDPDPLFQPSPLYGVIYLRVAPPKKLAAALAPVAGQISNVGVLGKISPEAEAAFLQLGVTRFCPAGAMQAPPLTWHHDGRMPLAELVTWIDKEVG